MFQRVPKKTGKAWAGFLRYLKKRGLKNIDMIISDKSLGLVESFPDSQSALMLVAASLRHIAGSTWSKRKYLNMDLLMDYSKEESAS